MGANDRGIDNQVLEVRIVRHRLENPLPDAFWAPAVEAAEHTVPVAERLWQIAPWRARPHDPKPCLDKQSIVSPRRAARALITDDVLRYPVPLIVPQDQTGHNSQRCPPKDSLESQFPGPGNP